MPSSGEQSVFVLVKNFSLQLPLQVHQRQAERMRARSDWFLSDPSGLVTYRFREKILSPRPTSLGPQVATTASPVHSTSRLPYSSTSGLVDQSESPPVTGKPPDGQNQGGAVANVALRRRLSDKDKEKRLVRRSSSKRKDKENGGADKNGSQVNKIYSTKFLAGVDNNF
jgi:hypothetical protein